MERVRPIIVIAGTTESREVIEQLLAQGETIVATTATELGTKMLSHYPIRIQEGKLEERGFFELFQKENPKKVIDASHPFAVIVTKTVKTVCEAMHIAYERLERKEETYEYDRIVRVTDINEAIAILNTTFKDKNILLTTGSNTLLQYVTEVVDGQHRIYARVLDHDYAREICQSIPLDSSHICYQNPPFSKEDTKQLIKQHHCQVLVTKDSGKAGGVNQKIEVAKEMGIDVICIQRPKERKKKSGILIAGVGSGCGKTTIVCGLLQALLERNVSVVPFKCGPDYIDPMLHRHITKRPSYHLDAFFMGEDGVKEVFHRHCEEQQFALIEGVMGFYDGMGLTSEASTYEIAKILDIPTILVLSVRGMAATALALLQGMIHYKDNTIKGVILNQCSKPMYERFKETIQQELGIPVLGYVPVNQELGIKERHLGLMTPSEIDNFDEMVQMLGTIVEQNFDLEQIIAIGNESIQGQEQRKQQQEKQVVKIGVAMDEAFCFWYEDNLDYLKEQGAELVLFSPIHDAQLPKDIQALYFIGGYPELYAKQLQQNETMKRDIRTAIQNNIPVIAECGGYLYLCETLQVNEETYEMVGVIPQQIRMTEKLNMHFGYVTLTANQDGLLANKGQQLKGHEFHYSKEERELQAFFIEKPDKRRNWNGGYHTDTMYAGYPHFHFRSQEEAIKRWLQKAEEFKKI